VPWFAPAVELRVLGEHCQLNVAGIGTVHYVSLEKWNVAEFLRSRTAASLNTVRAYEQDINAFIRWSEENGHTDPGCIERKDVSTWVAAMHGEGRPQKTMARRIAGVRQYFRWLVERGAISTDPTAKIQPPKGPEKLARTLPRQVIRKLLDKGPPENALDLRNRVVFELMYGSGLRVAELCALNMADFDRENELLVVEVIKHRDEIGSKDKKFRRLPMTLISRQMLELWINEKSREFDNSYTSGRKNPQAMFVNRRGNRLTSRDLLRIWHGALTAQGLDPLPSHYLRHTFATDLLNGGADVRAVQDLLGHKDIQTTVNYLKVSDEDLVITHRLFHPRGKPVKER
jgi:integrase/recombinase XerC